jgi:hypothetical protein
MGRRSKLARNPDNGTRCSVCFSYFNSVGGRRSHQSQMSHYRQDEPLPKVLNETAQVPVFDPEAVDLALKKAKRRVKRQAKRARQQQRRQAQYELIKNMYVICLHNTMYTAHHA